MNTRTPRAVGKRTYVQGARAKSAEETGRRIVDAFLALLLAGWFDEITLDRVAADAGVTVQTVVRRFGSKTGLLAEAANELGRQIMAQRRNPEGDIDDLVRSVIADYERTGDAIVRLLALEARQPAVSVCLDLGRGAHRDWVERAVGSGLKGLDAKARTRALDALVVVTDVYTWQLLRRDMGRSIDAAAATMAGLVRATLAEFARA